MRAVYKRTCEFPILDMARWLSHKPPLPTWSGNITWHYFMSSHFILSPSGCIQVCLSCTRISDKVPGKLGGAPTGDTRLLSNFPKHHVARSRFRTSIQTLLIRILHQKQSLSEIARLHVQNLPVYNFFIPDFNVSFAFISLLHWELHWTPWNFRWFYVGASTPHLIGDTPHVHRHLSTAFHITTRHWAKQHFAVTSLVCRSLVACWAAGKLWCSGLLLPAFCTELALNAVKLPLVLCWSKQHNVTDIWAPCSMSQHNTVGNSTHIEDHFSGSQNRAPAAWCAWKAPNQRVARWLSHKPPLPTWHGT